MPPISGRFNDGFTSARSQTFNVLDEPHFSFRPTTCPLTSPVDDHLRVQPPQSCKRKALLVGVDGSPTKRLRPLTLNGAHKDIRDMRQFLIGGFKFKFSNKEYFNIYPLFYWPERWHYDPDDIIVLMNNDDLETALQPTRNNIV